MSIHAEAMRQMQRAVEVLAARQIQSIESWARTILSNYLTSDELNLPASTLNALLWEKGIMLEHIVPSDGNDFYAIQVDGETVYTMSFQL